MNLSRLTVRELIASISRNSWQPELEQKSVKYHLIACWVALIFDPVFAITDYITIPGSWKQLLILRCIVSAIILFTVLVRKRLRLPSYFVVSIPFLLISLQNAYTYSLIPAEGLLGQSLNYMALLIGAAMFVLWEWYYSTIIVVISAVATAFFIRHNPALSMDDFFVHGGLLLGVVAIFMIVLIRARYNLTVKEIKARLALQASNEEIQAQAEEIKGINENLEFMVQLRTAELERKNKALAEYAFISAHQLRAPVASILGLMNLINKTELNAEARLIADHLSQSAEKLDAIVSNISEVLEKAERKEN